MQPLPVYTDFHSLAALRSDSGGSQGERLENAARQFSAVFANMLLKSMRQANLGDGIFDSQQSEFYQSMFDQQMALQLTQGEGFGIAELLVKQFTRASDIDMQGKVGAYEEVSKWSDGTQETASLADRSHSMIRDTLSS